jgi:hypothetical protein
MIRQLSKPFWALVFFCLLTDAMAQVTVSRRVSSNNDDLEEFVANGIPDLGSSDLELVQESTSNAASKQIVGLRFTDLALPKNAVITNAYIQFTTDENKNLNPMNVYIRVQDADNAGLFSGIQFDLANKAKLLDSVQWTTNVNWSTVGQAGPDQRTSNIASLVQLIVNRPGWNPGQAMAFFLTGEGTRTAVAHNLNPSQAPQLVVSYYVKVTANFFVTAETDDMEEYLTTGAVDVQSSDLELGNESVGNTATNQIVGMRFANVTIPPGATIVSAHLQLTYDNSKEGNPCVQTIRAEANANPATFSNTATFALANRVKTPDSVVWTIPTWAGGSTGTRGPAQRSPNIKTLVEAALNLPGWTAGNAIALYMQGTGTREAESYEGAVGHGNPGFAPELVIEYLGVPNPTAPIGAFPIARGTVWSYYADSVAPPTNWTATSFNDSTWSFGPAQLGYGDGDEATVLSFGSSTTNKYPSYYFRHKFVYLPSSANPIDSVIFQILRDDGAAVYLNGNEVFRTNMPTGTVTYSTLAASTVGGTDENTFFRFGIPASLLVSGINVLAVSLHQDAVSSSDISFDLEAFGKKPPIAVTGFPLNRNSQWSFWDKGSVATGWNLAGFNDSDWDYGPGVLGYGDPVSTTVGFGPNAANKYITTWFRKVFNIANISVLQDTLDLNMRVDDGAIVYINGTEVVRTNLPPGAITDTTWTLSIIDGANETTYFNYKVPKTVFVAGNNTVAVRVHQRDGGSSDMTFDLEIRNPPIPPPVAGGCQGPTDTHISCFTSVMPMAQTPVLRIPSTHRFQRLLQQGNAYTKTKPGVPFATTPGNNDFTAFVGLNGSSTRGVVTVNHETTPGGVTILDVRYDSLLKIWQIDTIQPVNFYTSDIVSTTRNCSGGITPWGTIVTAEETTNPGDANSDGYTDVGWLVEIDPWTKEVKEYGNNKKEKLWAMGRMSHENVSFKSDSLTAYYAEDGNTSCVYKFVANTKTNFSAGNLYVLKLNTPLSSGEPTSSRGVWVQVPNTTQADRNNTFSLAGALGGNNFSGPEDVEFNPLDNKVYFTAKGLNRVYRFTDNGDSIANFETFVGGTSYQINHGAGVATEAWGGGNDNLVIDDRGNVWVLQDGSRNHIWMVRAGHTQANPQVELFATTPAGSEPCGFERTPDNKFGFLSLQSPSSTNASQFLIDAKGDTVRFDRSTTVAIARQEFLGSLVAGLTETLEPNRTFVMKVYPNPSNGLFKIGFDLEKESSVVGVLSDMAGKIVFRFNHDRMQQGVHSVDLNLGNLHLPRGQYILQLTAGTRMATTKVVLEP